MDSDETGCTYNKPCRLTTFKNARAKKDHDRAHHERTVYSATEGNVAFGFHREESSGDYVCFCSAKFSNLYKIQQHLKKPCLDRDEMVTRIIADNISCKQGPITYSYLKQHPPVIPSTIPSAIPSANNQECLEIQEEVKDSSSDAKDHPSGIDRENLKSQLLVAKNAIHALEAILLAGE